MSNKKTIEVSEEMYDFLMDLSKKLNTQNHRATAMPYFFQIRTEKKVYVSEGRGVETWVNTDSQDELCSQKEIDEKILEILNDRYTNKDDLFIKEYLEKMDEDEKENALTENGYEKAYYEIDYEYKNSFLTEEACREHIRLNSYHYNNPVDYLSSAYRNPELEKVMTFLCELSGGKLHK